jgi:anti-sigma factor RsiW
MSTQELTLNLQAYVDGELSAAQKADVEKTLAQDADARALVEGLRQLSTLLKEAEPVAKLPDTREFYWSQIQRRIRAEEKLRPETTAQAKTALSWLRWLVPSLGVAAAAVIVTFQRDTLIGHNGAALVDGSQAEASSVVFRSESDGVTIHWIN